MYGLKSLCEETNKPQTFMREPVAAGPSAAFGGCDFFISRSFGGRKALKSMRRFNILGVLRLRAEIPLFSDRTARRFAQDDGLVVGARRSG